MPDQPPYILLIDDDTDDTELLSSSLFPLGIRVKTCNSGRKAISYLSLSTSLQKLPYLIILDYNMPLVNGEEVLKTVKNNTATRHIPVVIYSTTITPFFNKKAIELGAYSCITKPVSMQEFSAQIKLFETLAHSLEITTH